MPKYRVGVLGAGVIGLSSALQVIENVPDADVTIMADQFSPHTTGDGSAGFWEPFVVNGTNVREWSEITFNHLANLARSEMAGKLGAQFVSGYQLGVVDVDWKDIALGFRLLTAEEMAMFPKSKQGSFFTSLTIECSLYLPWLMLRFKEKGGKVQHRRVENLYELSDEFDLVMNCCGLGARSVVGDLSVIPVRGQVMKVSAPWIKHFVFEDTEGGTTYVLPGAKAVTVGGTTMKGDWNEKVDEKDKSEMWQRCLKLFPELKGAKHLYDWVGLRPYRPEVRVEAEDILHQDKKLMVVHNYGHGGAGVTLHWGCAQEARRLVQQSLLKLERHLPASKL